MLKTVDGMAPIDEVEAARVHQALTERPPESWRPRNSVLIRSRARQRPSGPGVGAGAKAIAGENPPAKATAKTSSRSQGRVGQEVRQSGEAATQIESRKPKLALRRERRFRLGKRR